MAAKWPVLLGLAAALAGGAYYLTRDRADAPKPATIEATSRGDEPTEPASPPVIAAPPAPSLPVLDAAVVEAPALAIDAAVVPQVAFDAQPRDAAWAAQTERELKQRFARLRGGKLQGAECRQTQCQVTIAGGEGDVGQTIADLEGPRGLQGYAENVVLTAPERRDDGTVVLRAFVVFAR